MTDRASSRLLACLAALRAWLLTAIAILIIATAVLVGVGRSLIPHADQLRPWLSEQLSERIGQPVSIGRAEAQWPRLTPQIHLFGLQVGTPEETLLAVDETRLELHLPALLLGDRNPFRLIVLGLELVLAEDDDGQWGLELEGGAELAEREDRGELLLLGDLLVRDASFRVRPRAQPEFGARLVEGEIRRRGPHTEIQGRLEPTAAAGPGLQFAVRLNQVGGSWRSARAWVAGNALDPRDWLRGDWLPDSARASVEAWASWQVDSGVRMDMDLVLEQAGVGAERVAAELVLARSDEASQLELVSLAADAQPPLARGLALGRQGQAWALSVDHLELGAAHALLAPLLAEWPQAPTALAGVISEFEIGWRGNGSLHALGGAIDQLSLSLADPLPSLSGLDLRLGLSGDRAELLPGGKPRVEWPLLFAEPVQLESLGGRALLSPQAIELDGLRIETSFAEGQADGLIWLWERRPFLDFLIDAERIERVDPRPYLPPRFIPETAMDWLERSLGWIDQASGLVLLHMQAGKLARDIAAGDFQADATFSGLEIDYWPDWPRASSLAGEASFLGRSLSGQFSRAQLADLPIDRAELAIEDLTEPTMALNLAVERAEAAQLAELLAAMPVEGMQGVLAATEPSGPVSVDLQLALPFRNMDEWSMAGRVDLHGTGLALPAIAAVVDGLSGSATFDRQRLQSHDLSLGDGRAQHPVALQGGFEAPAWLRVESVLNPFQLFPELAGLGLRAQGASRFLVELSGRGDLDDDGFRVAVDSNLEGLALDFPAPLVKRADQAWPLALAFDVANAQLQGSLVLEERLAARWRAASAAWSLALALGDVGAGELPTEGVRIRGQLEELALAEWWELLAPAGSAATEPPPVDVQVSLGRVHGFGLELQDLDLSLTRDELAWTLDLDSERMLGRLSIPAPLDSGRVLMADLQRLALAPLAPEPTSLDLALHPLSEQTSTRSPRGLPPLHVYIESLRWGELDLGRARLEAHASADGMEVELIDVAGPDLRLHGSGRWVERDQRFQSEFRGRLSTTDLTGLLRSAGYEAGLIASRAQVDADVRWPGAPMDFAMARLSGDLELRITDGTIPEARPGAGRLLGLASFTAIPRRLILDFRDVFAAGLKFDQIEGRFDLAAGFARTDGVRIRAPAANITISGDTDMAAREYDQVIVVEPGLGATLPVIGVLAGGPAGAAAGLVLRTLLERPLRGIAEARYSVTGPWDDPRIELVQARVTDEEGEEEIIGPPAPRADD
ncbi:MAG: TIGR02099 family protein [Wenzhouxiangellaceae bacterium]|nr:MAG: TIGR02099 family protein [Wenzhouxiangellaceae bacterium]